MFFFDSGMEPVKNRSNETSLEYISIQGLFGDNNVMLPFSRIANIYIGENGLGKTTVLNCIYYILTSNYDKLTSVPFDKISLKFKNEDEISVNYVDIVKYVATRIKSINSPNSDLDFFVENEIEKYVRFEMIGLSDEELYESVIPNIMNRFGLSYIAAKSRVMLYFAKRKKFSAGDAGKVRILQKKVSEYISERVIYLTTYRRIEKDFSEYFNNESQRFKRLDDNSLIHFGMKDVSKAITDILENIQTKTNIGFNKMAGVLLSKCLSNKINRKSSTHLVDGKLLEIVLNRLGTQIKKGDKEKILKLVDNHDIYDNGYQYLRDLIDELIKIYNQLKVYDEKIMNFTDVCNKYLKNKRFIYDQSELSLKLYSDTKKIIDISMLSSGEKQIVSLFSKLYLEDNNKCILLIDEPELSISMSWQKMLIPDIMRTDNCALLLTVTHSPFIFDNELDVYAQDMWYCFSK